MKPLVNLCVVCSSEIKAAGTGRPRLYCSDACRTTARRRRAASQEVGAAEVFGLPANDPDGAVLQTVLTAGVVAAQFAYNAENARPQFAWRCRKMADHITLGLMRWFEP